jgi:DNA-directed RNA polymerase specialized sigma24 family protein
MDREKALAHLPEVHAAALRLRDRGLGHDRIAAALEIEPRAVGSLLELAEQKLAALRLTPTSEGKAP